jgi:hypothetical protein
MAAKRGQQNVTASIKRDAALKRQKVLDEQKKMEDEQKKMEGEQKKTQDENPASIAADTTMANFLLLREVPTLGSEPSSSAVTLTPSVLHGDQRAPITADVTTPTTEHGANSAPEKEANTTEGLTAIEGRRPRSSRIATATAAKSSGNNETHGSSDVYEDDNNNEYEDVNDDINEDDDDNKSGEGRTPTKPFEVPEKRGRGRPFKSPSQHGIYAT